MSFQNSQPTERSAVLALLPPLGATTARSSTCVLPTSYGQLKVTCMVGDASASGTVTLIRAADASAGSSAAIATAALGGTATSDDNRCVVFNVDEEDMFDTTRPYFGVTISAGPTLTAAVIEGLKPRYSPPTQPSGVGTVAN